MEIDEDPCPLVASINIARFDLRALIESKKVGKISPRKVWVPKYWFMLIGEKGVGCSLYRSSIMKKFNEGDTTGNKAV